MTTSWPCSRASWAIPAPIVPAPTTPMIGSSRLATWSDRLELLERLAAGAAIAERAALGWPEQVVERDIARAAIRAAHRRILRGRCEAGGAQLRPADRADSVRGPRHAE